MDMMASALDENNENITIYFKLYGTIESRTM